MNNEEFEKIRLEYEKGKISVKELSYEQINELSKYYRDEVKFNKKEIEDIKCKIEEMRKKIESIV
jgi:hypothetical protein